MIKIDTSKPKIKIGSLQKGLVLHAPLDQESFNPSTKRFTDKTPYSNYGTGVGTQLGSSPTFEVDHMGQANRAAPFNGTDDYINYGNKETLKPQRFTLSAWIYPTSVTGERTIITSTQSISSPGYGYTLIIHPNAVYLRLHNSAGNLISVYGHRVVINEWQHITATFDGSTVRMYYNGVYTRSGNCSGIVYGSNSILIGHLRPGSRKFVGLIADVRVYNRGLSDNEIKLSYESYRPKLNIGSLQKGLVLDMPLRQPYTKGGAVGSEILTDRTPQMNDGTNHGATISSDPAVFDGTNDYVDCGDDESFNSAAFTVSFMLMTSQTRVQGIIQKSNYPRWRLFSNGAGRLEFDATGEVGNIQTTNVSTGEWVNIAFSYDGSSVIKIYKNGILNASATGIATMYNDNIGGIQLASIAATRLNGSIADVRTYNRALSDDEIKLSYES